MARARPSDEDLLTDFAHGLRELEDLAGFRSGVLVHVRRLVDCELASYNEIGPDPQEVFIVADPDETANVDGGMLEAFATYLAQNPLVTHHTRTGDSRALRLSDFLSLSQLHALELYDLVYRHVGVEYQLAFTVPSQHHVVGIAVSRTGRDFEDRELSRLDAATDIVRTTHHALHDRAQLDVIGGALDQLDSGPYAILLVEANGRMHPAHDRAARLLARLSKSQHAIETLRAWGRAQRRRGAMSPVGDLSLSTGSVDLDARYIHGSPGNLDAIALRASAEPRPHALRALGLTRRQTDVLDLVRLGHINGDIARALAISDHTVRHHLEEIYARLDVHSRSAAAHRATQVLAGAAGDAFA